jgi:hypothetical protein
LSRCHQDWDSSDLRVKQWFVQRLARPCDEQGTGIRGNFSGGKNLFRFRMQPVGRGIQVAVKHSVNQWGTKSIYVQKLGAKTKIMERVRHYMPVILLSLTF